MAGGRRWCSSAMLGRRAARRGMEARGRRRGETCRWIAGEARGWLAVRRRMGCGSGSAVACTWHVRKAGRNRGWVDEGAQEGLPRAQTASAAATRATRAPCRPRAQTQATRTNPVPPKKGRPATTAVSRATQQQGHTLARRCCGVDAAHPVQAHRAGAREPTPRSDARASTMTRCGHTVVNTRCGHTVVKNDESKENKAMYIPTPVVGACCYEFYDVSECSRRLQLRPPKAAARAPLSRP